MDLQKPEIPSFVAGALDFFSTRTMLDQGGVESSRFLVPNWLRSSFVSDQHWIIMITASRPLALEHLNLYIYLILIFYYHSEERTTGKRERIFSLYWSLRCSTARDLSDSGLRRSPYSVKF